MGTIARMGGSPRLKPCGGLGRRLHKPDPKLGPEQQDKRSVVPLAPADGAQWPTASVADAHALVRLAPADAFEATAMG